MSKNYHHLCARMHVISVDSESVMVSVGLKRCAYQAVNNRHDVGYPGEGQRNDER